MRLRAFYLKLAMETDVFTASETDGILEVARILRDLAENLENYGGTAGGLRDVTGKLVGQYEFNGQPLAPFSQYRPE